MSRAIVSADDKRWQAEDDVRTLTRAQEIQADKQRHAAAKAHAAKEAQRMQKVAAPAKTQPKRSAPVAMKRGRK